MLKRRSDIKKQPNSLMTLSGRKGLDILRAVFESKLACLVKQRTVCIINVWGYTEILPIPFLASTPCLES